MGEQFVLTLYTVQQLSDAKTMHVLWQVLDVPSISPQKYDSVERVKIPFQSDAFGAATELYEDAGMLFVKGKKDGFLAFLSKELHGLSIWRIYLRMSTMQGRKKMEQWLEWFFDLCGRLPVIYGYGCSEAEVNAKHEYVKEYPDGGRSIGTVGNSISEFYQYLPGLYWLNIFGPDLVRAFGQTKLSTMPDVSTYLLDSQQIAIRLDEPVVPETMGQRLKTESQLADLLGAQFFFDRNRTDSKFESVPELEKVLSRLSSRDVSESHELTGDISTSKLDSEDDFEYFERQVVLSPDETPYTYLKDLAEGLVIYLHTDVEDLFTYSQSVLKVLDAYFHKHPQALEYSREHLIEEFIPALGAYFGEVLVRELEGEWIRREPLLKSGVMIKEKELAVFRIAYQVVFGNAKLAEEYDSIS